MYSKIIVCLKEKEDEVIEKQIAMLSERNHAEVDRISGDVAVSCLQEFDSSALFICDDEDILRQASEKGITTNTPKKMKESYAKAMEMLSALGITNK